MSEAKSRKTLTMNDWAEAALDVIAREGVEALAVEPLARDLGVTKGSFYWHFANREALLKAALRHWEHKETDIAFARAMTETDGRRRIARIFRDVDGSRRAGSIYLALAAAARHPLVAETIQRVNRRRLETLIECYEKIGLGRAEAQRQASFAYSVFLGTLQMRRDLPEALPEGAGYREYIEFVSYSLIPGYLGWEAGDDRFDPPGSAGL